VSEILVVGASPFLDLIVAATRERDSTIGIHRDIATAPLERIEAFVCFHAPKNELPPMPRLRFAMSTGTGIDGLLACRGLPSALPLVRVVDPQQARRMAQYVATMVLATCRSTKRARRSACWVTDRSAARARRRWSRSVSP
jgi:phosphoglycerate dehydrogenase-like enzyme